MKDKILLVIAAIAVMVILGGIAIYFKADAPSGANVKTTHVEAYDRANGTHVKAYDRR